MTGLRSTIRHVDVRRRDLVSAALAVPMIVLLIRQAGTIDWRWVGVGAVVVPVVGWVVARSKPSLAAWNWFTERTPAGRGLLIAGWAVLVFVAASVYPPPEPIWQSFLLGLFLTMSVGTVVAYLAESSG